MDIENRLAMFKITIEALENRVIVLHDVERQLATIRSYKLFRLLSLVKRVVRKVTGRK